MTATEQIFHSTSTLKNTTSAPMAAVETGAASTTRLNVADVSSQFNLEFYNTMSRQPEHLHGFYGKQSQMVHSVEGDLEAPICTTLETIHARIMSMGYHGAKIVVESIDAQASLNGGIFILTTGNMKLKSGVSKKFVQSFFLAEQPNGYYVLNDCFRFLESPTPAPVSVPVVAAKPVIAEPKPVVAAAEPKKVVEETKPAPSPVKAAPAAKKEEVKPAPVAAPVEEKPKAEPVSEKPVAAKPQAAPAAPKKQVEEPKKAAPPAAPSSWASLAAGGSNMWQNGVVAPTNAPVVTAAATASTAAPAAKQQYTTQKTAQRDAPRTNDSVRRPAESRPQREQRPPRPESSSPRTVVSQDFTRSVFIRNLGTAAEADSLRKVLEAAGVITSFDLHASKGQAFVEFETVEMATVAITSKFQLNGSSLSIELRRPASQRTRAPRKETSPQ